jgi:hypothetical protein
MLRRRSAGESIRSIARREGKSASTVSHAFKVHDAELAARADQRIAAREAKAQRDREREEKRRRKLATQPAPASPSATPPRDGGMRINIRAFRRLNGLDESGSGGAYGAWLSRRKIGDG